MLFDWLLLAGDVGLRGWDYLQQRGSPFGRDEFIKRYSDVLSNEIDLVRFENPSLSELEGGTKTTLAAIAAVVKNYNRDDDVQVNANYMVPTEPDENLLRQAKFCDDSRRPEAFHCFLVLKHWAHKIEGLPKHLVLPVERPDQGFSDRLLFGAPAAYLNKQRYVVNDTLRLGGHLDKKAHAESKDEVQKFFKGQRSRYRSFVSWPIEPPPGVSTKDVPGCARDVIAVLNVQSNKPAVAGRSKVNNRRMEAALLPLMKVLSYFIMRLDYNVGVAAQPTIPVAEASDLQEEQSL